MERVQVLHGAAGARLDHDIVGSRRRRCQLLRGGDLKLRPWTRCRRPRFTHRFLRFDIVPFSGNPLRFLQTLEIYCFNLSGALKIRCFPVC